ncbi:MAG TPA: radical SAM protein [Gallicola sp.]|nr:radical SAM protein [Gallicola sp.]
MIEHTPFILKEIKIEVTHKCLLYCAHCSNDGSPLNDSTIALSKCIDIINQASEMGVKKIVFSGGEPLLWPSISKAVEFASNREMTSIIFTSGYSSDTAMCLKELHTLGLRKAVFSIYSSDNVQHDRITRKKGSFEKALEAITCSKSIGIETELNFVAMSDNFKQILEIASIAKEYDVTAVNILRFAPHGRGSLLPKRTLNKSQNLELRKLIIDLRSQGYNIRTGTPYNFLLVNNNRQCSSGMDKITIDSDLRIYPCDGFKNITAGEFIGTLDLSSLENETLYNCWKNSPYLLCVREYLCSGFGEPCNSCKSINNCMSGCTAQKVLKHGFLLKGKDPDCLM